MSKSQDAKKDTKKKPAKTMQEKKNAKREKKDEKKGFGSMNKQITFTVISILFLYKNVKLPIELAFSLPQ